MNLYCNHRYNLCHQPDIDRRTRQWMETYPPGHPLRHRVQELRLHLLMNIGYTHKGDSMLNSLEAEWSADSVLHANWLLCKIDLKMRLEQTDSAVHYLGRLRHTEKQLDQYYEWKATLYLQQGDTATAIATLQKAMQHTPDPQRCKQRIDFILRLLLNGGHKQEALQALRNYRQWMNRVDLPSYNYLKGELHRLSHQPDSAAHYYRIAQSGGDPYVDYLAAERLYEMNPVKMAWEPRFQTERQLQKRFDNLLYLQTERRKKEEFEKLALLYEMNQLKMSRQRYLILLMCLGLVAVTTGTAVSLFWLNRLDRENQQGGLYTLTNDYWGGTEVTNFLGRCNSGYYTYIYTPQEMREVLSRVLSRPDP